MNELQAILAAWESCQKSGETTFLATVVKTQGSTYRQPGARMLIANTFGMIGTISGGCLEHDVFEHTRQRLHTGEPIVVTYDTTANEDIVWGFGLGCNGVVQVLIERLDWDSSYSSIAFLQKCFYNKQLGVLATVFNVEGSVSVKVGTRLMLNPDGSVNTDIKEPNLIDAIAQDAISAKSNRHSTINKYQLSSGSVEVFIEVIEPLTHLIIFGAGRDATPVAHFAKALGWYVTVVDCRASDATYERFPMADDVILTQRDVVHKQVLIDAYTVAVVMTHNYLDDLEVLKMLLPSEARYIGILGSKYRTERLLQDLLQVEVNSTNAQLQKLYSPAGLDIGADTPEEIAIAIIAEIKANLAKRNGGLLRNRTEPIHQRYKVKTTQIEWGEKLLTVDQF